MALILIDSKGLCFCNCADSCVVKHKSGTSIRCNEEEIKEAGHHTAKLDKKSERAVFDFYTIDGNEKTLKIRLQKL